MSSDFSDHLNFLCYMSACILICSNCFFIHGLFLVLPLMMALRWYFGTSSHSFQASAWMSRRVGDLVFVRQVASHLSLNSDAFLSASVDFALGDLEI